MFSLSKKLLRIKNEIYSLKNRKNEEKMLNIFWIGLRHPYKTGLQVHFEQGYGSLLEQGYGPILEQG